MTRGRRSEPRSARVVEIVMKAMVMRLLMLEGMPVG